VERDRFRERPRAIVVHPRTGVADAPELGGQVLARGHPDGLPVELERGERDREHPDRRGVREPPPHVEAWYRAEGHDLRAPIGTPWPHVFDEEAIYAGEIVTVSGALVIAPDGRPTITRAQHKTNKRLYVEMSFAVVRGTEGTVVGSVAIARDATARYDEERARRQKDHS